MILANVLVKTWRWGGKKAHKLAVGCQRTGEDALRVHGPFGQQPLPRRHALGKAPRHRHRLRQTVVIIIGSSAGCRVQ